MRAFTLKVSLLSISFLVASFLLSASLAFAAPVNNWTPPSGPPLGNNTPSPINVSDAMQTKTGPLNLGGTLNVNGVTTVDDTLKTSNGNVEFLGGGTAPYFASFLRNFASYGNGTFQIGTSNGLGGSPKVSIFGGLQFMPTVFTDGPNDGTAVPAADAPDAGDVLTALDAQGNVGWRAASGGGGGGGTVLPTCTNNGDIIVFSTVLNAWQCSEMMTGTALPNATIGQTIWYNGAAWEATSRVFHDTYSLPFPSGTPRTKITNNRVELETDDAFIGKETSGRTTIASPSVVFGKNTIPGQSSMFYTDNIFFRGATGSTEINPGIGRIPYSADADGKFKWNEKFTFNKDAIQFPGILDIDVLKLSNVQDSDPEGDFVLFQNEGITYLQGDLTTDAKNTFNGESTFNDNVAVNDSDVTLNSDSSLFLEGVDVSYDTVKDALCVEGSTKKVVLCEDVGSDTSGIPKPTSYTYGPEDNGESLVFTEADNIDLEYCASGSGGGGGGLGATASGGGPGVGGAGGGGGGKGECHTTNISVNAGDVLTWDIGAGGAGGEGGLYTFTGGGGGFTQLNYATNGNAGEFTKIFINGSQVGQTADAPITGGNAGESAATATGNGGLPLGGLGTANAILDYWHDGAVGRFNPDNTPGNCDACGGVGGHGQSEFGQAVTNATGSKGGGGGYWTTNNSTQQGKKGVDGKLANGGGGGGGSYGDVYSGGFLTWKMLAGPGGKGGNGFLKITNVNQPGSGTESEFVWSTPGTYSVDPNTIFPDNLAGDTVTFQSWGAGGGGGAVSYQTNSTTLIKAGGGGSGGYATFSYVVPSCVSTPGTAALVNCQDITITVGSGGVVGVSGASQGIVTDSTDGGTTTVAVNGFTTYYAGGGDSGKKATYSTTAAPWTGDGGIAGVASGPAPSTQYQNGNAGQSSTQGGNGGAAIQGYGAGGKGSSAVYSQGQLNFTPGGNGAAGRVRVYWTQ